MSLPVDGGFDYGGIVKILTRVATGFAMVGFFLSVYIERERHRKAGQNTPVIDEVAKKLDLHFMKAAAAAGIPVGCALVYSAFDTQMFEHLAGMLPYIAISGLTLILACIRTLAR